MRNRLANIVLSLVIAALAATGAGWWVTEHRERAVADYAGQERGGPSEPGDRVRAAIRELRADGVHVAPDGRPMIDKHGEATLEKAVAGLTVPVRVIFWRETKGSGAYLDVDRQLQSAFRDERSVVLVWEGPGAGDAVITGGDAYVSLSASDFVGDPVTTITQALDEIQEAEWSGDRKQESNDYWGGTAGGIAAGFLFAFVTLLGLGLLLLVVRKISGDILRLPGRW
ncbi:hypothetical protein [Nocardioides jensenii]|uniref:hypothetical protein n=1 Tax=Nocardioides jensenii TaxID=1843 RepID=UPI000834CCD9|nr:hypothetical protein [Nocardioides jensenii]